MKNDVTTNLIGLAIAAILLFIGIFFPLRELFSMGTGYGILTLIFAPVILPYITAGINFLEKTN